MAGGIVADNALGWAQFKLRGGWKNIMLTVVAYVVVIVGLILVSVRSDPRNAQDILYGWMMGLTALQLAALLLFGCGTIRRAIGKDLTGGMMDSHRLMPVTGTRAVAGYMGGSVCQVVAVGCANLVIGVVAAGAARMSVGDWLFANVIIAVFAVFAWNMMSLLSFLGPAAIAMMIIGGIIFLITGMNMTGILPGVSVLCGPLIGRNVFGVVEAGSSWTLAYQISFIAQMLAAAFCFIGAVRKFRRDDVLAFPPLLGLVLVAFWVAISAMGIIHWNELYPGRVWGGQDVRFQLMASILTGMIVALVPVSAAAWGQAEYRRHRLLKDPALGRRPLSSVVVVLVTAILLSSLTAFVAQVWVGRFAPDMERIVRTGVVVAIPLLGISYAFRIMYRVTSKAALLTGIWIVVTWLGPLLLDALRYGVFGGASRDVLTELSGCSPIGALGLIWGDDRFSSNPGLVVQIVLSLILAIVFYSTQKGRITPEARPAGIQLGQS